MNNEQKDLIEQVEEANQDENIDETEDAEKTEAKTAEESTEAEEKPKKKNILQRIKDFMQLYRIKNIKELYKLATSKPETPSEAKAKTDAELSWTKSQKEQKEEGEYDLPRMRCDDSVGARPGDEFQWFAAYSQ